MREFFFLVTETQTGRILAFNRRLDWDRLWRLIALLYERDTKNRENLRVRLGFDDAAGGERCGGVKFAFPGVSRTATIRGRRRVREQSPCAQLSLW